MAKKTFKDNPAMRFISQPGEAAEPETEPASDLKSVPQQVEETGNEQEREPKSGARQEETPPEGYKRNMKYIEKRSHRLQLVIQPSLFELLRERAFREKVSMNDYVHRLLELDLRGDDVEI